MGKTSLSIPAAYSTEDVVSKIQLCLDSFVNDETNVTSARVSSPRPGICEVEVFFSTKSFVEGDEIMQRLGDLLKLWLSPESPDATVSGNTAVSSRYMRLAAV